MAVELVTFKIKQKNLEDIDKTAKNAGFQNRTEFIRTALREKVEEFKIKKALIEFHKLRGKARKKISEEERIKIGNKIFDEFEKRIK